MASFDDFLDTLKTGVAALAKETLSDFADRAIAEGEKFLEETQEDLEKWARQLTDGDLSADDFEFLLGGKKDLLEIHLLVEVGAAKVATDKFRQGLFKLIVDTAAGTFL